ncbi:hypothetical protein IW140_000365 [Coemansia sp. RSA 1813]|nr:hypothetical protein EV178_000678 [Coemansia sp. RSA 1646]KAJ1773237.1 hypothetical protein LPJ74_000747 [Coemansia sp. RSA 1843]KAJ2092705.1 hypothetical protein IW138_000799 [Coemansia sp. RSA 986]KAJ2217798.1 hypothetical protein EV179_000284 [Coemansia sp. RSA 487]KAJ2572967.1 hypothetical protein IW140_000365 [Coemansia sp. RSA 1813]
MAVESANTSADKLNALLKWFEENKVTFNQEAIEIVPFKSVSRSKNKSNIVSADGFGVIARRDLLDDEPLVVIPKAAVLSAASSALAALLNDEKIGDTLALHMAIMYEMSQGHQSPWYGYLQSLPDCADVPLLWEAESRKWLQGTDVSKWVEKDEAMLKRNFEQLQDVAARNPFVFVSQNGVAWNDFTCFLKVASLASSRAFLVDVYQGSSMVPFADIFNHRTNSENVHIESEEMVCPLCGEAFGCEHIDGLEQGEEEKGGENTGDEDADMDSDHHGHEHAESDDGSGWEDDGGDEHDEDSDDEDDEEPGEELPLLLDETGNPLADETQTDSNDTESDDQDSRDGIDEDDDEDDKWIDTLDIVVFRPCKAKREVFNTYGKHSSAALLHRYGFCDTDNPFDSVTLDTKDILQAFSKLVSEKRAADIGRIIDLYADVLEPRHRAKGIEDDNDDEDDDKDEDGSDEESGEEDTPMMEDENDEDVNSTDDVLVTFSIDAPGHPDLNLAALLVLGLAEEDVFAQMAESQSIFMHYFPLMRRYWAVFQDKVDSGASIEAAYRKAGKATGLTVKQATAAAVCRAAGLLAESRLTDVADDMVLGQRPAGNAQQDHLVSRWESAKLMRENERSVLKHCAKLYQKISAKLSS